MKPGFTLDQVREELGAWPPRTSRPRTGNLDGGIEPLLSEVTGRSRQIIWLLVAAGALVVLVACANIAGLSVARAASRQDELALRRALGANRWQLVRVGLAENLLIGVGGAVLGLLLAWIGLPLLRQLLPADFPRAHEIGLTWQAACLRSWRSSPRWLLAWSLGALVAQQRVTEGRQARRLRTALVVGEIALAGVLCAGALFLARSFHEIAQRDHGFDPHVLTFQVAPRSDPLGPRHARTRTIREAIARVPGVSQWARRRTSRGAGTTRTPGSPSSDAPRSRRAAGLTVPAAARLFRIGRHQVLKGRFFDRARDVNGQPLVLLVNESLARRYFPQGDAVGSRVNAFGEDREIVGIVADVKTPPRTSRPRLPTGSR